MRKKKTGPNIPQIDLSYVNAAKILVPNYRLITLILVGCGGTGSWLSPTIARVARLLIEKFQKEVRVFFIDHDVVEAKNVYRQNFCDAEVGRNKAEALAFRYGLSWGISITAIPAKFESRMPVVFDRYWDGLTVVIGAVDGAPGRKEIAQAVAGHESSDKLNFYWLDCGNARSYGQVLLGNKSEGVNAFSLEKYCIKTPFPHLVHPELLVEKSSDVTVVSTHNMSCADLAMIDSQALTINQRVASEAGDFLNRLLLTRDLTRFVSYFDLESDTTQPIYATPENVGKYIPLEAKQKAKA